MGVAPSRLLFGFMQPPEHGMAIPSLELDGMQTTSITRYIVMRLDDKSTYEITIKHGEKRPSQICSCCGIG